MRYVPDRVVLLLLPLLLLAAAPAQGQAGVAQAPAAARSDATGTADASYWRTARNCGLNCLFLLLRSRGHELDYDRLADVVPIHVAGSSLDELRTAAESLGYRVQLGKGSPADLETTPLPVLVHLNGVLGEVGATGHYMLLTEYRVRESTVRLFDGASALVTEMSTDQFRRLWSGYVLLAEPPGSGVSALDLLLALTGAVATFAIWLLFRRRQRRRNRAGRAVTAAAVPAGVMLMLAVPSALPGQSAADAARETLLGAMQRCDAPLARVDLRCEFRRVSPLDATDLEAAGIRPRDLRDAREVFTLDGSKWHHTFSAPPETRKETLFDGVDLHKARINPAIVTIFDPAMQRTDLRPGTILFRARYFERAGIDLPNSPSRLHSLPASRVLRLLGDPTQQCRVIDDGRGGTRVVEHDATAVGGEVWRYRLDPALGYAVVETEMSRGGSRIMRSRCRDFTAVGEVHLPRTIETDWFRWGDGAPRPGGEPVLSESATAAISAAPAGHAFELAPAPGSRVFDSRWGRDPDAKEGFLGFVQPHPPDRLLQSLERELRGRGHAGSPSPLAWWLGPAFGVAAAVALLLARAAWTSRPEPS